MPNVRCPSCGRLLNLPEGQEPPRVQCPLCHTEFDPRPAVVQAPRPAVQVAAAYPLRPRGAVEVPVSPGHETAPLAGRDQGEQPTQRQVVLSAATWMQAASALAFVRGLCCCILDTDPDFWLGPRGAVWGWIALRCLPALLFYLAGQALQRQRRRALAMTGAVVGLLLAAYLVILAFTPASRHTNEHHGLILATLAMRLVTAFVCAVASVKALRVLTDPAIRNTFRPGRMS